VRCPLREGKSRFDGEGDINGTADAPATRLGRSTQADENAASLDVPDVDEHIGVSPLKNLRMYGSLQHPGFAILG